MTESEFKAAYDGAAITLEEMAELVQANLSPLPSKYLHKTARQLLNSIEDFQAALDEEGITLG